MNQTKKRLSIIKLAISITDIETIQLQMLKLTPIKTDTKIQEILTLLQAGSYAQSQALITNYIDDEHEEILQRTSQKEELSISPEEQSIIDEFQLFVTTSSNESKKPTEIDINDFAPIAPKITKDKPSVDFDSLLNLDANDILVNNINIDVSEKPKDTFFSDKKEALDISDIPKDTFFDTNSENELTQNNPSNSNEEKKELEIEEVLEEQKEDIKEIQTPQKYNPIPDIAQKLIAMKYKYPLIQKVHEKFDTVDSLLNKIANDGYSETEIEEMISYIKKLIEKSKYTESAQLLLVCAATESQFAQFMLARELYTGSVLTKNIPEAFTLMNTLAIKDYPEALCDLGQFYENGIGTTPDLLKAEGLYKEALHLGIKRAKKHYNRLRKLNKGFFK